MLKKTCEWCKNEFKAKTARARMCSRKCMYASNHPARYERDKERLKPIRKKYYQENKEKLNEYRHDYYDRKECLTKKEEIRLWRAKIKKDPVAYERYLAIRREEDRRYAESRKKKAERAAYVADPLNAARVAIVNQRRMTEEERAHWTQIQEKKEEDRQRKERREEVKREHAAKQVTAAIVTEKFGDAFGLEWSQ